MPVSSAILCGAPALLLAACDPGGALQPVVLRQVEGLDGAVLGLLQRQMEVVRGSPRDAGAHGTLGLMLEANDLWQEASASLRNAARLDRGEPLWRYHLAIALDVLGESSEAIELLRGVVAELPDAAYAEQRLGEAALAQGDFELARRSFQRASELAPERPEGPTGIGICELAAGRTPEAARALERAVALDSNYKTAHYQLGLAYRALGRENQARRELAMGLGGRVRFLEDPFSGELNKYRKGPGMRLSEALALLEAGKNERAARILQSLLEADPGNVILMNDLAIALQRTGKRDRAFELFQRSKQLDGGLASTWTNLALFLLEQGTTASALEHADQAIALQPSSSSAHMARARVLLAQERTEEACAELEHGLRLDPRKHEALRLLGNAHLKLSRLDQAEACFATLAEKRPFDAVAPLGLAEVALARGQEKVARREFSRARSLAPDHPEVLAFERRLEPR